MSNIDDYGRQCLERVNSTPIEVGLFFNLLGEAQKAMRGKRRELPPDAERCFEDAPPDVIYAKDSPMNQLAFAIIGDCQKLFPNDKKKAEDTLFSFVFRWMAINKAHVDGLLAEFTQQSGEVENIRTEVFEAAADCKITADDGKFDDTFVPRIRAKIAESEAD